MNRGRDQFYKYKGYIEFIVKILSVLPKPIRLHLFVSMRSLKGRLGLVLRYTLLKTLAKYVGDNVSIGPDVYLLNVENLSIGHNVSIHPMSYIEAYGGITICDDVAIAHATTIMSVNHRYDEIAIPIKDQGIIGKSTIIESNVWIGAKSTVLAGITVGSGSIVAAGAVVTKNVDKNCIVGGVPAQVIKVRR